MRVTGNERGIALIVTLLIVALLTITVIEFTDSVEVDQHMARNALNGLQASLLARAGINLGEAFLLHDDHPEFDAYVEDWGNTDELNSQLVLPDNMRLRVQIIDEGGKLNINLTRPTTVAEWKRMLNATAQNPAPTLAQVARDALRQLLLAQGADPQAGDAQAGDAQAEDELEDYWNRLFTSVYGDPNSPQPTAPPGTPTPVLGTPNLLDFPSLDDASIVPLLTPSVIRRLRPYVTALPGGVRVNANTAPRAVLQAILGDGGVVDDIISQRQANGLKAGDLASLVSHLNTGTTPGAPLNRAGTLLTVTSQYFRVRASAVVNPNPLTGQGGIRRSAEMLVQRQQRRSPVTNGAAGNALHWTLTRLDWQKEPGGALFDQQPGVDGAPTPGITGMGG